MINKFIPCTTIEGIPININPDKIAFITETIDGKAILHLATDNNEILEVQEQVVDILEYIES